MAEQEEWESTQAEIFRFEKEGDSIIGVLKQVRDGRYPRIDSSGNVIGKSKIYTIDANGKLYTIFGTTVLENRMSNVNIGDTVKIVYVGLTKNKRGQQLKNFEVYKKKA